MHILVAGNNWRDGPRIGLRTLDLMWAGRPLCPEDCHYLFYTMPGISRRKLFFGLTQKYTTQSRLRLSLANFRRCEKQTWICESVQQSKIYPVIHHNQGCTYTCFKNAQNRMFMVDPVAWGPAQEVRQHLFYLQTWPRAGPGKLSNEMEPLIIFSSNRHTWVICSYLCALEECSIVSQHYSTTVFCNCTAFWDSSICTNVFHYHTMDFSFIWHCWKMVSYGEWSLMFETTEWFFFFSCTSNYSDVRVAHNH